jgi:hypothetical protein
LFGHGVFFWTPNIPLPRGQTFDGDSRRGHVSGACHVVSFDSLKAISAKLVSGLAARLAARPLISGHSHKDRQLRQQLFQLKLPDVFSGILVSEKGCGSRIFRPH